MFHEERRIPSSQWTLTSSGSIIPNWQISISIPPTI